LEESAILLVERSPGSLAVDGTVSLRCAFPGELTNPLSPDTREVASAMASGEFGSNSRAASPASSGSMVDRAQVTGVPSSQDSRRGRAPPSNRLGKTVNWARE
jgi:hypothetical protein